jgi:large-conductance mechanosensitive channel
LFTGKILQMDQMLMSNEFVMIAVGVFFGVFFGTIAAWIVREIFKIIIGVARKATVYTFHFMNKKVKEYQANAR